MVAERYLDVIADVIVCHVYGMVGHVLEFNETVKGSLLAAEVSFIAYQQFIYDDLRFLITH